MLKFLLTINGKPKMAFHDNEEVDACEAYLHSRKFYGKEVKLFSIKFRDDEVKPELEITELKVERKSYVYSHSRQ